MHFHLKETRFPKLENNKLKPITINLSLSFQIWKTKSQKSKNLEMSRMSHLPPTNPSSRATSGISRLAMMQVTPTKLHLIYFKVSPPSPLGSNLRLTESSILSQVKETIDEIGVETLRLFLYTKSN